MLMLYLLFVGVVIIAALVFAATAAQRLQTDVEDADFGLAQAIALETDAALHNAILTVEQLAQHPAVINVDPEGMEDLFGDIAMARSEINLIYRLGADGLMLFHHPIGPGSTIGVDFSFREYFADALQVDHAVISKGRISPTTNQAVVTTVMPIRDQDFNFLGVVATNIRLTTLSETLGAIADEHRSADEFRVLISDATGQVIAAQDPSYLLTHLDDTLPGLSDDALAGERGTQVIADQEGEEWLVSFIPIPSAGWSVVVTRPTSSAFGTMQSFYRGLMLAIGVFLLGGLAYWLGLSRQVIQPLQRLADFSQAISYTDEQAKPHRRMVSTLSLRSDHIGHLARSLSRMERSIQQRFTELQTVLDSSKVVVSSLHTQEVLDRILELTSRLIGADMCAIVALDRASNSFRVQASRNLSVDYITRLSINPAEPRSPTMRSIRSGQPVHISDTSKEETYPSLKARAQKEGYQAVLAVPLPAKYTPPSVLSVYFAYPRELSEREISLVWNFANHAAMAIQNAALFARSDERLQEQTRRLEALVQSMSDGLILEDLTGRVLYCNRRLCELAELTPEEIQRYPASQVRERLISWVADHEACKAMLKEALRQRGTWSVDLSLDRRSPPLTLRFQSFEVTDRQGEVVGHGRIIQDITRDRALDRMKTSLIATVSHELRTPLAAIKGYASTLLAEDVQWDHQTERDFLTVISQESDRLSDLVTDLLDLSKIEAGSLIVERTTCPLHELIENAIYSARPAVGEQLQIHVEPNLPAIRVDSRRIEVVLRNLLENAAKYAGPESPIVLSARREDGQIVVKIEDEGPGIPEELSHSVFEPFVRLDDGLSRSAPGAGLGLSICRGFVHAHGGEIWLEPRERGVCVSFSLPLIDEIEHG
ncbi:MAG TPA: GAF domain-containing protein [Anaerolineae bacterium]|nr:GAF domain-containing protein [Anaerolineae bacterium]